MCFFTEYRALVIFGCLQGSWASSMFSVRTLPIYRLFFRCLPDVDLIVLKELYSSLCILVGSGIAYSWVVSGAEAVSEGGVSGVAGPSVGAGE